MDVIAQNAAEAIISSLILGLAIAAIAWSVLRVLAPGRASSRFAVWFTALGAVGLVPLLQIVLRAKSGAAEFVQAGGSLIVLPQHWAAYLLWSWALAALVGLGRVAFGVWHLHRERMASTVISPAELSSGAREVVIRAARSRAFELRASDQVRVPMAIGFWRPAIVLPRYLMDELSPAQVSQVLLHETSHLLRYDDWTNLLQKIVRAVLFFHPAVWWLESKLTLEREMACDEVVVAKTSDPRSYAECLALLAEKSLLRRTLALVQTAVSRFSHTSLRVKELLVPTHKKRVRAWSATVGVIGVLASSAVLVQAPDLVSFKSRTTAVSRQVAITRFVPVQLASESGRSQLLPAALKHDDSSLPQSNRKASTKVQRPSANRAVIAQPRKPVENQPQLVLASGRSEQAIPVPVLVTTTMIVESSGEFGVSQQVWRMWRVTVYYPAADNNSTAISRKI